MSFEGFCKQAALLQAIERDRDAVRDSLQASRNKYMESEAKVSSCRAAAVEHAKTVSTRPSWPHSPSELLLQETFLASGSPAQTQIWAF